VSTSRERTVLVFALNVAVSILVVGVAFAVFGPGSKSAAPGGADPSRELAELRREVAALRDGMDRMIEERERLRSEVGDLAARIAGFESAPRRAGGPASLSGEGPDAPAPGEPSAEERMMKGIAEMMRSRIKQERDRYVKDLLHPTEASERRQKRGIERGVRFVADRLGLSESETAEVTRVLTEVDDMRRRSLKSLIEAKQSPEDVGYGEVKKILDESFVEEDRMIEQALSPEKAADYQESAGAFRQMVYGAAKMAFPEKAEKKEEE
jgi:hypothetical protein